MTRVDFSAGRKAAERSGAIGSGVFKVKDGANRVRLVSMCIPHQDEYQGRKNFKWLCLVIDREDGQVKPYFMPHSIYKAIEALQVTEDYSFDSVPMPYDITINAKNAGTKDVEYGVVPARQNKALTAAEEADVEKKGPIEAIQDSIRAKKAGTPAAPSAAPDFDPDELPA